MRKCLNLFLLTNRWWSLIHPSFSLLDPELHSFEYVRHHSAWLFTCILASTSLLLAARLDASKKVVDEAMSLQNHAEKLSLVVYATRARSIEIIQAHLVSIPILSVLILDNIQPVHHAANESGRGASYSLRRCDPYGKRYRPSSPSKSRLEKRG